MLLDRRYGEDSVHYVHDTDVVEELNVSLSEARRQLDILEHQGLTSTANSRDGRRAMISRAGLLAAETLSARLEGLGAKGDSDIGKPRTPNASHKVLEPEAPKILREIYWILLYGKRYWWLIALALLVMAAGWHMRSSDTAGGSTEVSPPSSAPNDESTAEEADARSADSEPMELSVAAPPVVRGLTAMKAEPLARKQAQEGSRDPALVSVSAGSSEIRSVDGELFLVPKAWVFDYVTGQKLLRVTVSVGPTPVVKVATSEAEEKARWAEITNWKIDSDEALEIARKTGTFRSDHPLLSARMWEYSRVADQAAIEPRGSAVPTRVLLWTVPYTSTTGKRFVVDAHNGRTYSEE